MIKTIVSLGDSFTYGDELDDKKNAWPFILGQRLNAEVKNYAVGGGSNDQIIRKLVRLIVTNEIPVSDPVELSQHLVIIAWTMPARTEFHDQEGFFDTWPARDGRIWRDQNYPHRLELTKYITLYHDDSSYHEKYLQQIIIAQNLCKSFGIKYTMLDVVHNDYYKKQKNFYHDPYQCMNRVHAGYDDYQSKIDKDYYIDFGIKGMLEWVPETVPKGSGGHFLEEGHSIVAEHIYENIRNFGWVS